MEQSEVEKAIIGLDAKMKYVEKDMATFNQKLSIYDDTMKEIITFQYKLTELNKNMEKLSDRLDKMEEENIANMKSKECRNEQNKNEVIMTVVRTIISVCVGAIIGKYI